MVLPLRNNFNSLFSAFDIFNVNPDPTATPTTSAPSETPTTLPTTDQPTELPTTAMPTATPSAIPTTAAPTEIPTAIPSTERPSTEEEGANWMQPTYLPTFKPNSIEGCGNGYCGDVGEDCHTCPVDCMQGSTSDSHPTASDYCCGDGRCVVGFENGENCAVDCRELNTACERQPEHSHKGHNHHRR